MGKILLSCDTNSGNPRDCVEWAVAALCESLDCPTLRNLAGLDGELNGFEVRDYMEKALKELGVDLLSGADAASVYARYLAREVIDSNESVSANLKTLSGLYTTYAWMIFVIFTCCTGPSLISKTETINIIGKVRLRLI